MNKKENDACEKLIEKINNRLKKDLLGTKYVAVTEQPLRYYTHGITIDFNDLLCKKANYPSFKIDILIYEQQAKDSSKIPRVAIETKFESFNTHDVLTYSTKVQKHKILCPYLQYGFVVLQAKEESLPCRYFSHADNFDFAYMYQDEDFDDFYNNIILKALENSQNIENIDRILCNEKSVKPIKWYRKDMITK